MSVDQWAAIGIVCGAILAFIGVIATAGKVLGMLWQWRFGNEIKETMKRIEAKLDAHLQWHADPGGRPAKPEPSRANGPDPTRARRPHA